jgi:hypothetical protein
MKADADNRYYGRFKLQRLDAEALRDSMLAAAGTLNRIPFGKPIGVARDPLGRIVVGTEQRNANGDVMKVVSLGKDDTRRSIYIQVRRRKPVTVLETFDEPTMLPNCDLRNCSTVAPQSLMFMNDDFVLDTSRAFAARLREEAPGDARAQITKAWRILFSRVPAENDVLRSLAYIAEQTEALRSYDHGIQPAKDAIPAKAVTTVKGAPPVKDAPPSPAPDPQLDALASYCQILYSSNRFLYVE